MLEYLLTIVLIIGALIYIVRSIRKKSIKATSDKKKKFGKWNPVRFESPRPVPYPDWSIERTRPLPYRPFKYGPDYFITMGIARLDLNDWIELDNEWTKYHNEKISRLSSSRSSHLYKIAPEAQDAALETMELLSEYLVHRYPSLFEYHNENEIRIKTTGEIYPINSCDPLKYASLLIQDDLALMIEGDDGQYYLKGGIILIPGFWRMEDKFNMPLAQIHLSGDVPKFKEKLQHSMERFFQKMTPQHPVLRYNYFIQTDGELAWSPSIGPEDKFGIGWDNAKTNPPIEQIHFRSERQTLRRLPRSGAILFTIRPYFIPLVQIAKEPGIPGRLASAIRSWPDDVSKYKGKKAYEDVILKYLDEKDKEQSDNGISIDNSKSYPY
jgi:alpha-1,2-mannosyltransferase